MVQEVGTARGEWPLAVVEEVREDEDGVVRRAWVRTARRARWERHVSSLVLLEATPEEEGVEDSGDMVETKPEEEPEPEVNEPQALEEFPDKSGLNLDLPIEDQPAVLPPRRAKVAAATQLQQRS